MTDPTDPQDLDTPDTRAAALVEAHRLARDSGPRAGSRGGAARTFPTLSQIIAADSVSVEFAAEVFSTSPEVVRAWLDAPGSSLRSVDGGRLSLRSIVELSDVMDEIYRAGSRQEIRTAIGVMHDEGPPPRADGDQSVDPPDLTDPRWSWNAAACETCFAEQYPGLVATRLRESYLARCSWCAQATDSGVFVRRDPASVPYPRLVDEEKAP